MHPVEHPPTRPRPPARRALARHATSNSDARSGGASTPLTALPLTPRAQLRRARSSLDGAPGVGVGGSTPRDTPRSLQRSRDGRAARSDTDKGVTSGPDANESRSSIHLAHPALDQDESSAPGSEAAVAGQETRDTLGALDRGASTLGSRQQGVRGPTPSATSSRPSSADAPVLTPLDRSRDTATVDPVELGSDGSASRETLGDASQDLVTGPRSYESLSRSDLEYLLSEADRVLREKEKELATFTAAGQGLLDEYNRLRQQHEALAPAVSRSAPSSNSSSTQTRPRGSASPYSKPSDVYYADPNATFQSPAVEHDRRDSVEYSPVRLRKDSMVRTKWMTPRSAAAAAMPTPGASPTSLRSQGRSSTVSTIDRPGSAPNSRILFSAAAHADETAVLSQANYALTLQLSEVQAETEAAEREGRKKLRKLERELQSLRADLERVEQRNAILEKEVELASVKQVGSLCSAPASRPRAAGAVESPRTPEKSRSGQSPPRYRGICGGSSLRDDHVDSASPQGSGAPCGDQPGTDRRVFLFPRVVEDAPADGPTSDPSAALLPRSVPRSVSTSSLVPLPPPIRLDPSLDKQQDELVEQLMAKIDELQDTNHVFLAEREHMFHRLTEAQEEVYDWKERCEELEDENQQHRLIGWRNDVDNTGQAWLADGGVPGPTASSGPQGPPADDRLSARSLTDLRECESRAALRFLQSTDGAVASEAWQPLAAMPPAQSLADELRQECASALHASADRLDGEAVVSLVVRNCDAGVDCGRGRPDSLEWPFSDLVGTTRDDLLPAGSLRYSGYPTAEKYEELERAVAGLEPMWADADTAPAHQTRMAQLREARLRVSGAPGRASDISHSHRGGRKPLRPISIDDESPVEPNGAAGPERFGRVEAATKGTRRRRRARRRLSIESSLRKSGQEVILHPEAANSAPDSEGSSTWSDFDMLEHSLRRRADYQAVHGLARLHPSAVAGRAADSVSQHVGTLLTWLRFMVLLSTAVIFALWQGPQKTLGPAGSRRRLQ
ncbi:hypothetical protein JCM3774_000426 [Rhodotorula dairenensis]